MNQQRLNQRGFAMAAMFIAVFVAGMASLNLKTSDGTTVASAIGIDFEKQAAFSALETNDSAE